jgi:hypothetical protein
LLEPEDGADFSSRTMLRWTWDGTLRTDEYFDVRVWREGDPHYGVAWTKQPEFLYDPKIKGPGTFYWSIAVIQGHDGQWLADMGPEAPPRRFTISGGGRPYGYGSGVLVPPELAREHPAPSTSPSASILSALLTGALLLALGLIGVKTPGDKGEGFSQGLIARLTNIRSTLQAVWNTVQKNAASDRPGQG